MRDRAEISANPRVTRRLDLERNRGRGVTAPDGHGVFVMRVHGGAELRILMSADAGWDHVSVSLPDRCPTWAEMDAVKRACFLPQEVVMQLHVGESDHINLHPNCLHLWRPHEGTIPLPPKEYV